MSNLPQEDRWMLQALKEAEAGLVEGEPPIGAVIVNSVTGSIIARAHHQEKALNDPTAHATMIALTQLFGRAYVDEEMDGLLDPLPSLYDDQESPLTLVVTREPCVMCAGAILLQSRIERIYFGTSFQKWGACGSMIDIFAAARQPREIRVYGRTMHAKCSEIFQRYQSMRKAAGN